MTIWTLPRCLATQRWQVTDGLLFLKAAKFCRQGLSQHAVALLQLDANTGLLIFFFVCPRKAIPSKRMLYQKVTPSTRLPTTHADSLILAEPHSFEKDALSQLHTTRSSKKRLAHNALQTVGCEHRPSNGSSFSRPSRATPSKRMLYQKVTPTRGMRILSS